MGAIWFLVLDMHLLIRAIGNNRLAPQCQREQIHQTNTPMAPFALPPEIVAMMAIMIEQTN